MKSLFIFVLTLAFFLTSGARAAGSIRCEFKDKNSTATVTNDNSFQSTCTYECLYRTDGDDHINRGKAGLNPSESRTSNGTSADKILDIKSKSVNCGGAE